MPRILLADCEQEISSFNPVPSDYGYFSIKRGEEIFRDRGLNTQMGGALSVFDADPTVELVPTMSARAPSAGILARKSWRKLSGEILASIEKAAKGIDGIYFAMHGAMGAEGELDPEGYLLQEVRKIVGERMPIVISLDLHGIMTERMLRHIDGVTIYHTYPHVDFADTGARGARMLLRIIREKLNPVIARVVIPALVRGDELVTKSGCYGDILREARRLENEGKAMFAGVMIGNPFTDVPELCSQAIVVAEKDAAFAEAAALGFARAFWPNRHRMQGKLIPLEAAIAQAKHMQGPVIFTDAADATSSGATGDSNVILAALMKAKYQGRVLVPIVDPPAAAAAKKAGIGAKITVSLGGTLDKRFTPLKVTGTVDMLSGGHMRLETARSPFEGGDTAVLISGNYTILIFSKPAYFFDRAPFLAHGRNPRDYDLIVVKSPHCEYHMFDEWAEKNFNIDAPGSTSADIKALGHTIVRRPMFPLDPDIGFEPKAVRFHTKRR
jgi:microcystin degradation protein MlrC